jgi:DNA-binding LytR/AlgR family response regulator
MQRKYLFIKLDKKYRKLHYEDIQYVMAWKKYVKIKTEKKIHLLLLPLSEVEKKLPADMFCRVHRSYIVSLNYITEFDQELVMVAEEELPISRPYRDELSKMVDVLCCEVRGNIKLSGDDMNDMGKGIEPN